LGYESASQSQAVGSSGIGDIAVFNLAKEKRDPIAEISIGNSVHSTPILANNVLSIANKDHVFAMGPAEGDAAKAGGE
jgi:hypothetical protein